MNLYLGLSDPESRNVTSAQIQIARKNLLRVENPLGKKFIEICTCFSISMHEAAVRNQAYYEATRLFLAIRIFTLEHGELPAGLNALVDAKILDAVPINPLSTEPIEYSRTMQAIWSVGSDGQNLPAAAGDASEYEVCVSALDACPQQPTHR